MQLQTSSILILASTLAAVAIFVSQSSERAQADPGALHIAWTIKESVRAQIRVMVKRILKKCGYPPDKQESATQTVLERAEALCREAA
jgi:type I restriction enzyme R subunit